MMSKSTVPGEFQGQLQGTIAFMAPEVSCPFSKTDVLSPFFCHMPFVLPCVIEDAHTGASRGQLWAKLRHLEPRLSHHRDGNWEAALGSV